MDRFVFSFRGWDPADQPRREALSTLANGWMGTRGAAAEAEAGDEHQPGTYLAGVYNRLEGTLDGRAIVHEDLVNAPNWLPLSVRPRGGDWLDLDLLQVLEYEQRLDLRGAALVRTFRVEDGEGRRTRVVSERHLHLEDAHRASLRWQVTAENWTGEIEVRAGLDGGVINEGVRRYRVRRGRHLAVEELGADGDLAWLAARTVDSRIRIAGAFRLDLAVDGEPWPGPLRAVESDSRIDLHAVVEAAPERTIAITKSAALCTSRQPALYEPLTAACETARRAPGYDASNGSHRRAWERLWSHWDLQADLPDDEQRRLMLYLFHVIQHTPPRMVDLDAGLPARGLTGEAYQGHVFWDELFVHPLCNLRVPEVTRSLLRYRVRRLDRARLEAREHGWAGALFPWRSASDGREVSPELQWNPRSGRWMADPTDLQHHVSSAVAYAVAKYHQASGDLDFLSRGGAQMLLEVARFWSTRCELDPALGRYRIRGVVGPDEFHTAYPDAEEPGIDDNAYTNVMAVWVLRRAAETLDLLAPDRAEELAEELAIDRDERRRWEDITRRMHVPTLGDGVLAQFAGWEELAEVDWEGYRERYGDLQRLDWILEAEGDSVDRYKASKQPDVLMLFYLLELAELREILGELGLPFDEEALRANVRYYAARTTHGSTLSRVVESWVHARSDPEASWESFRRALDADVGEHREGSRTSEGVHLGAMAGTIDLLQRCYGGVEVRRGRLRIDPQLPPGLDGLRLPVLYHGHWIHLRIDRRRVVVAVRERQGEAVRIRVRDEDHTLRPGEERELPL